MRDGGCWLQTPGKPPGRTRAGGGRGEAQAATPAPGRPPGQLCLVSGLLGLLCPCPGALPSASQDRERQHTRAAGEETSCPRARWGAGHELARGSLARRCRRGLCGHLWRRLRKARSGAFPKRPPSGAASFLSPLPVDVGAGPRGKREAQRRLRPGGAWLRLHMAAPCRVWAGSGVWASPSASCPLGWGRVGHPLFVAAAGRRAEEAEVLVEAGLRGLADAFQDEPHGGGHVASGPQGGRGRSLTGPPAGRPGPERGVEEQESWQGAPVLWGRVCHLLHQVRGRGSGTLGQASQDSGGRAQTTDQVDPGAQTSVFSPVQWVWPLPVASKTTGGSGFCGLLGSQAYRRLAACSVTDSTFLKASNSSALPDPEDPSCLSSGHSCRFWHSPGHCTGGSDQNHPQKRHAKRQNGCLRRPYK